MKESRIVEASVHDPFIVLVLENKTIIILQCDDSAETISPVPVPSDLNVRKIDRRF